MKYRLAVFDMDGTLLDTLEDLADSLNYILEINGYPGRTIDEVRSFVGNGIHKLIERALPPGTDAEEIDRVFEQYVPYYQEHAAIKTRPYDGITAVIERLRNSGVLCAVVSNKADGAVQELCRQYFDGLFDAAAGDRPEIAKKPAPDMCGLVLERLGISKEEAVYIGDSEVDIETARNSGMDEIIVSWGFRTKEFQIAHGAKRIIDSPQEILDIILE